MQVSIQDLIDRMSILIMKAERLGHPEHIKELGEVINELNNLKSPEKLGEFLAEVCKVAESNADIWNLEFQIRQRDEDKLGLDEVGKRALAIRDRNADRIAAKNKIGDLTKTGFKEIKFQHRSRR